MALGSVSPVAVQAFYDANGDPISGGKLYFYLAGTSTLSPAYADINLTVPLANPVILDAAGRAPELFMAAGTYKQVLQNAGGTTIWTADNIVTPTAFRTEGSAISLTGSAHDVAVPSGLISWINFNNSAVLGIDGFAGGVEGQLLFLRATGTANVSLVDHTKAFGSAATNLLYNFATSGPTQIVPPTGTAIYAYQAGGWRLMSHEQGAWIQLTGAGGTAVDTSCFAGTDGAGVSSGQWLVQSSDIFQCHYRLNGSSLMLSVQLFGTSIIGAPVRLLVTKWPYQFKTLLAKLPCNILANNAGPYIDGVAGTLTDTSHSNLGAVAFEHVDGTAWAASSDLTAVFCQLMTDVI